MNGQQYSAAIRVSTEAALKSGKISLQEIIGTLQLAIINTERVCYQHAIKVHEQQAQETTNLILPPNGIQLPKR
jgi:hypothetical protein